MAWHRESKRHSLASRGIKTAQKISRKDMRLVEGQAVIKTTEGVVKVTYDENNKPQVSIRGDLLYRKGEFVPRSKMPKQGFARDKDGKISSKVLSEYGKKEMEFLDGAQIYFSDIGMVTIKKDKMIIDKTGKLFDTIDSDLKVNKIIFRIM